MLNKAFTFIANVNQDEELIACGKARERQPRLRRWHAIELTLIKKLQAMDKESQKRILSHLKSELGL